MIPPPVYQQLLDLDSFSWAPVVLTVVYLAWRDGRRKGLCGSFNSVTKQGSKSSLPPTGTASRSHAQVTSEVMWYPLSLPDYKAG